MVLEKTLENPLDRYVYIFLPFYTVHGVLMASMLEWFAIPFSSGSHSVRPLHHDPPVLGCPKVMA